MNAFAVPSDVAADPFRADIPTDNISPDAEPEELVAWGLKRFAGQQIGLTTAFGMEGCALIDMVARAGGELEVTYLDTHFFFDETHRLREKLEARYPRLRFVNRGTEYTAEQQTADHGDRLWERNPDQCCYIRKVLPMKRVMAEKGVWFTALRRSQSPTRANLQIIE
ncbi:MAG: phosphoadenosine phosphosulfate reductase family protein, partial [Planctomycetota bacterium]